MIAIGWALWHQQVPEAFQRCSLGLMFAQLLNPLSRRAWGWLWWERRTGLVQVMSSVHFFQWDVLWFSSFVAGRSDCGSSQETPWWMFPAHLLLPKHFGGCQSGDTGPPGWWPRGISYAAWPQASSLGRVLTSNILHSCQDSVLTFSPGWYE